VTVGGLNQVKVFRTDDYSQVTTIDVGALPHGIWPSGDGSRVYVGLENADSAAVIDTLENKLIATIPVGQGPQGVVYVPGAVPDGPGTQNLVPLGVAAKSVQMSLGVQGGKPVTQVTLFDQGLVQVLQAGVTGLEPRKPYVLALSAEAGGGGTLQPLAAFMTNPVGAAIVNAIGPIRQFVQTDAGAARRWLVIAPGTAGTLGTAVQVQQ
jgi:YVTN family beta-propeller protein